MKNSFIKILIPIIAASVFFSCGSSKYVSFNVTRPAEISMPAAAKTILLVDRTKPGNEMLNVLEGILTGELPADDKIAAQEALMSLMNRLHDSPRFTAKISTDRLKGNSIDGSLPKALDWNVINQLCVSNNADLVVSLELFDSDFIVTKGTRVKKKMVGEGANKHEEPYTEFYAQGIGIVKMGIRTYYNKDKSIVDQQLISRDNNWEGTGSNPMDALAMLISKSNANKYLAKMVGDDYAYKISPMPVSISRSFFPKSKHSPAVARGTRFADVDKWKEAIDEWKRGINGARTKDAGMLAYNIAIGYEVLGDYGTALTWAQDSYTKYENKQGRDYVRSLKYRINEETALKEQMLH